MGLLPIFLRSLSDVRKSIIELEATFVNHIWPELSAALKKSDQLVSELVVENKLLQSQLQRSEGLLHGAQETEQKIVVAKEDRPVLVTLPSNVTMLRDVSKLKAAEEPW